MFNKDFYPTPPEVVENLIEGLSLEGKNILDPESGKGNILKLCKQQGAITYGCEIEPELYEVSKLYGQMIGTNFLDMLRIDVAHIEAMIMNPPFSAGISHFKHAWNIAPDGCIIRCLINADNLKQDRFAVKNLLTIVEDNHGMIVQLGKCFTGSERHTNVNVAMICINKPEGEKEDWDSYFSRENLDQEHASGLMKANVIDEIVGRYVGSLKKFDSVMAANKEIEEIMGIINVTGINFGCTQRNERGHADHLGYEGFKTALQKSAWKMVFEKMNMEKYMTSKLKEKIAKFVEEQSEVPFNVENIYNMLTFIASTNGDRMGKVLIEVFDAFTKHHDENRHNVEGWKTNSHYMINKKIIVPYVVEERHGGGFSLNYSGNANKIDDLTKALCFLVGESYEEMGYLQSFISHQKIKDPEYYRNSEIYIKRYKHQYADKQKHFQYGHKFLEKFPTEESYIEHSVNYDAEDGKETTRLDFGKWYTWGFFEIKAFKKGTMHMKFIDDKVCELFNLRVAEAKGFELPDSVLSKETQAKRQENPATPLVKLELPAGDQIDLAFEL